ncbi:hypothetical protein HB114_004736 [Escherichia coli]|nr:hypothetical protein [Escherichia coli]
MDGELKNMKLNINQLAALSGLARDAGLKPMAVNRVQSIIDDLCNQIISRMVKNDVVNEVAKQA